jgi:uncharacterized protein (TIGR03067 family)
MRTRLIALAVFALIGVTAFAPAPFMKSDHGKGGRGGDVLAQLQGTWKIADKQRMGPNGQLMKYSTAQCIVIEKETWQFTTMRGAGLGGGPPIAKGKAKGGFGASYKIVLDASRRPVEFRLKRTTTTGTDYMVGIIHPSGDTVKIAYCLGTAFRRQEVPMPRSFDDVPEGWYSMTLKRE